MKKVLVIDDEPPVARLISAALDSADVEHTIDYCRDGGQGRTKAAHGGYDLITLDLHMPLMGGIEAIREMKRNPRSAGIPIVVVTGEEDPAFHNRARQFGAAAIIIKPFQIDLLGRILSRLLAGPQAESVPGEPAEAVAAERPASDLRPLDL